MHRSLLALVLLSTLAQAHPQPRDLLCDICVDVVTDLDEWLTSDATEGEIVHFMESVSICNDCPGVYNNMYYAAVQSPG